MGKRAVAELLSRALADSPHGVQTRLAAAIGVSQPTVFKWKNGESVPSPHLRRHIETELGLPPGAITDALETPSLDDSMQDRIDALEAELSDLRRFVVKLAARIEET